MEQGYLQEKYFSYGENNDWIDDSQPVNESSDLIVYGAIIGVCFILSKACDADFVKRFKKVSAAYSKKYNIPEIKDFERKTCTIDSEGYIDEVKDPKNLLTKIKLIGKATVQAYYYKGTPQFHICKRSGEVLAATYKQTDPKLKKHFTYYSFAMLVDTKMSSIPECMYNWVRDQENSLRIVRS